MARITGGRYWASRVRIEPLEARWCLSVSIRLDYSLDASGFFTAHPQAKTVLQSAADQLTARLGDTLSAIVPTGGNTWTVVVTDPATGDTLDIDNPTIPADTIVVYAGSRALGGPLGIGGPAGWSASGTSTFLNTVSTRGEPGAGGPADQQTDFAPAGGSITFDPSRNWNFDPAAPHAGADDFLSVSLHELGHVLGFGTANSWENQVFGGVFNGAASVAAFGQPVPVSPDQAHWAAGVSSDGQVAAMTPSITVGTRKLFTTLDFAGLDDVGWDVTAVAARVSAVYVSGSQWAPAFKTFVAQRGLGNAQYGFDVTSAPTAPLPWSNLNQVSITFDHDLAVGAGDLIVTGTGGAIPTNGFTYSATAYTATWTFPAPLAADRLLLDLPTATGGDFRLRFNVLPGDVTRSGAVLADDFSQVKQKFFSSTTNPGAGAAAYTVFHDVNGSGSVLADDFSEVKRRFFTTLPAAVLTVAAAPDVRWAERVADLVL